MSSTDLSCWIVRYQADINGVQRERYLGSYPEGQEDNPWSEVLIGSWEQASATGDKADSK